MAQQIGLPFGRQRTQARNLRRLTHQQQVLRSHFFQQALRLGLGATHLNVLTARRVSNGAGSEPATHGCFDNAIDIMGQALGYIVDPVAQPKVRIERLAE